MTADKVTDRFNARISTELKHIIAGIQQCNNDTQNVLLKHFVDLYFKYHDGSADKQIQYCAATNSDVNLVASITQFITELNATDVMRPSEMTIEIRGLKQEVFELRSQIQYILKIHPDCELSPTISSKVEPIHHIEPTIQPINPIQPSTQPSNQLPAGIIGTMALNDIINSALSAVLSKQIVATNTLNYDYYIYNFNDIRSQLRDASVIPAILDKINNFNEQLHRLLMLSCESYDMCESFLPNNPNVLSKYLDARLTNEGIDIKINDIWDLSLQEIHDIICKLTPYTAQSDFKVTGATIKSPQAIMKSVLSKTYGFIFKDTKSINFQTF